MTKNMPKHHLLEYQKKSLFHIFERNCVAGYTSTLFVRRGYLSNETMMSRASGNSSENAFNPFV